MTSIWNVTWGISFNQAFILKIKLPKQHLFKWDLKSSSIEQRDERLTPDNTIIMYVIQCHFYLSIYVPMYFDF